MPTTILDEAKVALRVTVNDADITAEIQRYIDEAILDLTRTADIASMNAQNLDAFQKGAVLTYVKMQWTTDANLKDRLRIAYEDYKAKMLMSSSYRATPSLTIPPIIIEPR